MGVFLRSLFASVLAVLAFAGVAAARFVGDDVDSPQAPSVLSAEASTDETTTDATTSDAATTGETTTAAPDTTAPAVTIVLPADGETYAAGHTFAADFACEDETGGSGLETCAGTVDDGAAIDTAKAGKHEFTVTATDKAGNAASATVHYAVAFAFAGLSGPLASQAGREQEPGRAIPVTFGFGADLGLDVFADGYPASRPCGGADLVPLASPGAGALSFDTATQQYTVVWKTSRDWGGTCRDLVLRFADGSEQRVQVTFRDAPQQGTAPPHDKPDKAHGHGR